jgi:hypothetical protein
MSRLLFYFDILIILLLVSGSTVAKSYSQSSGAKIAYIHDIIDPTLDEVKWSEEGGIEVAPSWIFNGYWNELSVQQSLVSPNDIFVSWFESFNWSLVSSYYRFSFTSFDDFTNYLTANPTWWINNTWGVDPDWCGISSNTSKVILTFNETTSEAGLSMWFHITRIPEYFVSHGGLQSWLVGFDLTPVSTGGLEAWEFHEDWNMNGTHYNLYFKAPAHVLAQHGGNFTFNIAVSTLFQDTAFNNSQVIDINMPANTEIKETSPSSLALQKDNTATFVKAPENRYPEAFTVTSGPPAKSLNQVIMDSASAWFLTPGGWAAIVSLVVITFTGLRGRKIWNRNKLYHRLYKSMVTLYDMHPNDYPMFHQEMDSVSRTVIKTLVEDKITDEQFEKLLHRRDDLLERSHGEFNQGLGKDQNTHSQPPPPAPTVQTCPTCGSPMRFIQQNQRWYCDKERKYI